MTTRNFCYLLLHNVVIAFFRLAIGRVADTNSAVPAEYLAPSNASQATWYHIYYAPNFFAVVTNYINYQLSILVKLIKSAGWRSEIIN